MVRDAMDTYHLPATERTPEIIFDFAAHHLRLCGESYPEDAAVFYAPVFAVLAKYLSPQVYQSVFSGRQAVEIARRRKKLSVLFADLADFTGISERLQPEELTGLLHQYLTEMSRIAAEYGATIDKLVGDAIVMFFGDPETRGVREDALARVRAALAMQARMRELDRL